DRLKGIPARLCNFAWAGVGAKINRRMKNDAVTSSRQRLAMDGNKNGPRTLLEPGMRRGNTGMQSKTANGECRRTREKRKINQQRDIAITAQSLKESKNSPGARGERMAGLFAPAAENRIEQRIPEFLGYNRCRPSKKSAPQTEPFEIAVVTTDDNRALLAPSFEKSLKFNVASEIFRRKPRAPHQVEHGLGKVLIGFTKDAASLSGRIFFGKGAIDIVEGNAPATRIDERRHGPADLCQHRDGGSGEEWHEFGRH